MEIESGLGPTSIDIYDEAGSDVGVVQSVRRDARIRDRSNTDWIEEPSDAELDAIENEQESVAMANRRDDEHVKRVLAKRRLDASGDGSVDGSTDESPDASGIRNESARGPAQGPLGDTPPGEEVTGGDDVGPSPAGRSGGTSTIWVEKTGQPAEGRDGSKATAPASSPATRGGRKPGRCPAGEITDAVFVRPALAILPELSMVTVSIPYMNRKKGIHARHMVYVQYPDGCRECRVQAPFMELGGVKLLLSTPPSNEYDLPGETWTAGSRQAWMKGAKAPDMVQLFMDLSERMGRYIYVPEERRREELSLFALWSMLSYVYEAFPAFPYLYLTGPYGTGKSQSLDVFKQVAWRPISSSNTTAATLFHWLNSRCGTVLLDEAEHLNDGAQNTGQLLSILLAGYRRGEQVTRVAGRYRVYGPKVIACIGDIPRPLLSRCIPVEMTRAPSNAPQVQRCIASDSEAWVSLRNRLYSMAVSHGAVFLDLASQPVGDWLTGRQRDVWQPVLSLAGWLEDHGAKGLRATMEQMARRLKEAQAADRSLSEDEVLLRTAADLAVRNVTVTAGEMLEAACKQAPMLFSGRSARWGSSRLARYGLRTEKTNGSRVYRPAPVEVFLRIQQTYGLDLGIEVPAPAAKEEHLAEEIIELIL